MNQQNSVNLKTSVSLLAPAKVNLFLHITGRRENGYHELESLFVRTNFGDRLTLKVADDISLSIKGPFAAGLAQENPEDNLVMRAARKMVPALKGRKSGVHIMLEKNLPVASGIGGGSADAAALLLGLLELWQLDMDTNTLQSLALELGADVPACLSMRPQWVTGIGDMQEEVSLGFQSAIVLVNPNIEISTPAVFKKMQGDFTRKMKDKMAALNSVESLRNETSNALYRPAAAVVPTIREVITELEHLPGNLLSRMSGSGATCFALFPSSSEAEKACAILEKKRPDWWVKTGSIL